MGSNKKKSNVSVGEMSEKRKKTSNKIVMTAKRFPTHTVPRLHTHTQTYRELERTRNPKKNREPLASAEWVDASECVWGIGKT